MLLRRTGFIVYTLRRVALEKTDSYTIRLLPGNQKVPADAEQTLLEALIGAGILLRSDCGGKGLCGKCLIRISDETRKQVSPVSKEEAALLGETDIREGYRLACKATATGDIAVEISAHSRLTPEVGQKGPTLLPKILSAPAGPGNPSCPYGLAVDLGTTTIALYLCDLSNGAVAATLSVRNPQAMFGDDVMSRIGTIARQDNALQRLQKMAVKAIEWGLEALCHSTGINPKNIGTSVVVGNSAMIHILVGESPASIGVYPYDPGFVEARTFKAKTIGLTLIPSAEIHTLPLVAGFLGADIVAAALATALDERPVGTMLVDVGTNGEVMLVGRSGLLATSCATGPAFEGATIRHGMQAISGAIDKVKIDAHNGGATCSVLQNQSHTVTRPSGICGTGVVSAVAELFRAGIVSKEGKFNHGIDSGHIRLDENGMPEYVLVPAEDAQTRQAITLTQKDVRAIQLAKGALLTGLELLCHHSGLDRPRQLLVAGAFGSYIDKDDAGTIGMFPLLPEGAIDVVGNAAGAGAILTLFDPELRRKAQDIADKTTVLDLASLPEFQDTFLRSLSFPADSD
ncbi:MAG: ASKHA domain-containing protein [Desulfobacterales bacterium]